MSNEQVINNSNSNDDVIAQHMQNIKSIAVPAEAKCRGVLDRGRNISADFSRMIDHAGGEVLDIGC